MKTKSGSPSSQLNEELDRKNEAGRKPPARWRLQSGTEPNANQGAHLQQQENSKWKNQQASNNAQESQPAVTAKMRLGRGEKSKHERERKSIGRQTPNPTSGQDSPQEPRAGNENPSARTPALERENKMAAEIQRGQENCAREPLHEAKVHRRNKNNATVKPRHGSNSNRRKLRGTEKTSAREERNRSRKQRRLRGSGKMKTGCEKTCSGRIEPGVRKKTSGGKAKTPTRADWSTSMNQLGSEATPSNNKHSSIRVARISRIREGKNEHHTQDVKERFFHGNPSTITTLKYIGHFLPSSFDYWK
jgi:hypothetical protein